MPDRVDGLKIDGGKVAALARRSLSAALRIARSRSTARPMRRLGKRPSRSKVLPPLAARKRARRRPPRGPNSLGPRPSVLFRRNGRCRPVCRRDRTRRPNLGQRRLRVVLQAGRRQARLLRVQVNAAGHEHGYLHSAARGGGALPASRRMAISTSKRRSNCGARSTSGTTKTPAGPSKGRSPGRISSGPAAGPRSMRNGSSRCAATTTRSISRGPSSRPMPRLSRSERPDFPPLRGLRHAQVHRAAAKTRPARWALKTHPPLTTLRVTGSPEPPLAVSRPRAYAESQAVVPDLRGPRAGEQRSVVRRSTGGIRRHSRTGTGAEGRPDIERDRNDWTPGKERVAYGITFHPSSPRTATCTSAATASARARRRYKQPRSRATQCIRRAVQVDEKSATRHHRMGVRRAQRRRHGLRQRRHASTSPRATAPPTPTPTHRPGHDQAARPRCCGSTSIIPTKGRRTPCPRTIRSSARKTFGRRRGRTAFAIRGGFTSTRRPANLGRQQRQDLWEQVYLVERGDNYGWSVTRAAIRSILSRRLGPTPVLQAGCEHPIPKPAR